MSSLQSLKLTVSSRFFIARINILHNIVEYNEQNFQKI